MDNVVRAEADGLTPGGLAITGTEAGIEAQLRLSGLGVTEFWPIIFPSAATPRAAGAGPGRC